METIFNISKRWKAVADFLLFTFTLTLLFACHSGQQKAPAGDDKAVAVTTGQPVDTAASAKQADAGLSFFSKGTIESVSEVAVASSMSEQIVMLGVEMGKRVQKGQVLVQLSRTATEDKIMRGRAELERAEYQYQNILMGQGYKRGAFDQAPENIRNMARSNSGYNTAKAALRQMEHQLNDCTIKAPISGVVTQLNAVLYSTAMAGETLFRIVDTEHLKVCFDILENELQRFEKGTEIIVSPVSFPDEQYTAHISAISPVVEKNGTVHLEAALDNHPHLKPGMSVVIVLGKME